MFLIQSINCVAKLKMAPGNRKIKNKAKWPTIDLAIIKLPPECWDQGCALIIQ